MFEDELKMKTDVHLLRVGQLLHSAINSVYDLLFALSRILPSPMSEFHFFHSCVAMQDFQSVPFLVKTTI